MGAMLVTTSRSSVGVLHPGQMGTIVASALHDGGARVLWCPTGRSASTRRRAELANLEAVADLRELLAVSDIVFSVCPPAAAEEVAERLADQRFQGLFVDANAISPVRLKRITDRLSVAGAHVVDGALFGARWDGDTTRLYLAGRQSDVDPIAALLGGTGVSVINMGSELGRASALKMAHSTFQKASRVLAALAFALADGQGVTRHLLSEADGLGSALAQPDRLPGVAARAWRWAPEMHEVADALRAQSLPPEIAYDVASILQMWALGRDEIIPLDAILKQLSPVE
jgi:3-hydroxyisobutyrate dehydrogenase-like beta-hydroxyacid dehydrogenase